MGRFLEKQAVASPVKAGLGQRLSTTIRKSPLKWGLGVGALVIGSLVGGLIYFFQSGAAKKIAVSEVGKDISSFMGDNKMLIVTIAIGAVILIFMKMRKS